MNYRVTGKDKTGRTWIEFEGVNDSTLKVRLERKGGLKDVFGMQWSELVQGTEVLIHASKPNDIAESLMGNK